MKDCEFADTSMKFDTPLDYTVIKIFGYRDRFTLTKMVAIFQDGRHLYSIITTRNKQTEVMT